MSKTLNIIIPMAGKGSRFRDVGYTFPKPIIDIKGKTMIEVVINNLKPDCDHKFIFICQREHYEKYDLYNILKNATDNKFEIVQIDGITEGAVCTVLCALQYINNENDIVIANSDQFISMGLNDFINDARCGDKDGLIMTFKASHPKWSYARVGEDGNVVEVAEKRVISDKATVGIYYFKSGKEFIRSAQSMIEKDMRHNNEFYVCPVYNEMILEDKNIGIKNIEVEEMHGLGTPEDLNEFLKKLDGGSVKI
ncbi:MAG: glycosyltransferase family 2 protein [Candidatus Magasanikbacteria bacterium]|nr:glycosyltransferase family 2 protein [Candidatus Magasanikbacteria bacterium]